MSGDGVVDVQARGTVASGQPAPCPTLSLPLTIAPPLFPLMSFSRPSPSFFVFSGSFAACVFWEGGAAPCALSCRGPCGGAGAGPSGGGGSSLHQHHVLTQRNTSTPRVTLKTVSQASPFPWTPTLHNMHRTQFYDE